MLLGKSRVWIKESLTGLAPAMFRLSKRTFYFFKILFFWFLLFIGFVSALPPPPLLPTRTRPSSPFVFFRVNTENPYYYPQSYLILISLPLPLLGPLLGQIYTIYRVTYLPIHSVQQVAVARSPIKQKLSTTYRHLYRVHKPTLF